MEKQKLKKIKIIGFYNFGLHRSQTKTLFGGMYHNFYSAISKQPNTKAIYINNINDINKADILVLTLGVNLDIESCQAMDKFNGPIIVSVATASTWFNSKLLKRWSHKILFTYNTDESEYGKIKYKKIGISHLTLPFASNPNIFKPLAIPKIYDILFVGSANSGKGRHEYIEILIKKAKEKNWKIMIFGRGWEKYGFPLQLIAHGELLNYIYNSAKICININHNLQKENITKRLDANNRIFDLALSECFQVSNAPQIINKYFSNKEICAKDNPQEWVNNIEYYLNNKEKMKEMVKNCKKTALNKHTWENRANLFIRKIKETLPGYSSKKIKNNLMTKLLRKYDCWIFGNKIKKIILRIKKRIKKII